MALAARGPTVGVDRDPIAVLLAEANLAACRLPNGSVQTAELATLSVAEFAAWHIDPDRRPEGRRTTRVVLHDPPPAAIECLLAECPHGAVKFGRGRRCCQTVGSCGPNWNGSAAAANAGNSSPGSAILPPIAPEHGGPRFFRGTRAAKLRRPS